jgi:hypothetical protein
VKSLEFAWVRADPATLEDHPCGVHASQKLRKLLPIMDRVVGTAPICPSRSGCASARPGSLRRVLLGPNASRSDVAMEPGNASDCTDMCPLAVAGRTSGRLRVHAADALEEL